MPRRVMASTRRMSPLARVRPDSPASMPWSLRRQMIRSPAERTARPRPGSADDRGLQFLVRGGDQASVISFGPARSSSWRSGPCGWAGDLGFEVCEPPVLEAHVGAGGLESFVQGPVVGGELPYSLFEGGVLGGDALDGPLGPLGLQVPDLAEELAEAGPLLKDLGVGRLERFLGVEGALAPGRLLLGALRRQVSRLPETAGRCGVGHRGPGLGIAVEERARDTRPPSDGGHGDRRLLASHPGEGVVNALQRGLGAGAPGRECGRGLRLGPATGAHAHAFASAGSLYSAPSSSWPPALARSEARNAVFQTRWK